MSAEPDSSLSPPAAEELEKAESEALRAEDVFWASVPALVLMYSIMIVGFLILGIATREWLDVGMMVAAAFGGVLFYRRARQRRLKTQKERDLIAELPTDPLIDQASPRPLDDG
ncbi:MAG: hypothetical protein ACYTG5_22875 [Planctomycetota bacterium]